jgi:two-component system phosphate regulon sensor histidine kinase PhoR
MSHKLKELDELKDSFVSSVSHELRSPLTAIDGYVEYLITGLEKNMPVAKQQKALQVIKESTSRLSNFITNILDTAKIKAGHFSLRQAPLQLESVISEIVFLFDPVAAKNGMNLSVKLPDNLPAVWADRERVAQVLTNLIGNALKFSKEGTSIKLSAALSGSYVTVYVADTGLGIPLDQQGRIFERFYQVVDHSYSRPKGTGLGLAIAAEIVKMHGGEIGVHSEPGKGSVFHFTLPVEKSFINATGGNANDK